MRRNLALCSVALATLVACASSSAPRVAPISQVTVDAHVADARQIAGEDLKFLMPICNPQPAVRAAPSPAMDEMLAKLISQPAPEPGQAFDNLYYVGSAWVSAWVLKTSAGLILIDALNNTKEAAELIEGGMRKLGLGPAQIKYVLVTHGHGDHYGGAQMLADRYRARVIASEIDWAMMETGLEFDSKQWDRPPKRDIAVKDGDTFTLGDTTVRYMVTPGHTLGTISPVFDVRHGGKTHKAMIWGGTSFNFGRDMQRLDGYIAQTERMRQLSAQWGIDVPLSNHPGFDGTVAKLKAKAAAGAGAANPFVSGQPVVDRAMRVLNTCAKAQRARFMITTAAVEPAMALSGRVAQAAWPAATAAATTTTHHDEPDGHAHEAGAVAGALGTALAFPMNDGLHGALCEHPDHP